MNVRIVPHSVPVSANSSWWKVQMRVPLLRIGRIRLWRWKTVGDYSIFETAKKVAKTIVEEDMIDKYW
jgi:hypothetical protein